LELLNKKELEKTKNNLIKLLGDIQKETKIPLSYMGEYYNLKVHANLILNKIEKLIKNTEPSNYYSTK